jgi:hypothetical protein
VRVSGCGPAATAMATPLRWRQKGGDGGNGQQEGVAWRLGGSLGPAGGHAPAGGLPSGERDLALSATVTFPVFET